MLTAPAVRTGQPRRLRLAGLLLLAVSALVSCHNDPVQHAEYFVFGTLVEVSLAQADEQDAVQAFTQIQDMLQSMHQDWHAWEPGRLQDINQAFAAGTAIEADNDVLALVRRSQTLEQLSGGRFNPAIGRLVALWGFHTSDYPVLGPPPTAAAIEQQVSHRPSMADIRIDASLIYSTNPWVQLDFGGIAKGLAVDRIADYLKEAGFRHAIINAGGDLRAFGQRASRPWRIAVRNPLSGVAGSIDIRQDEAVFTSGNYERYRLAPDERRYPHIIDPRSGWPAEHVMAATVIAADALVADAAATALVVAGLAEWREVADGLAIDTLFLTDENGTIYASKTMRQRLQAAPGVRIEALPGER